MAENADKTLAVMKYDGSTWQQLGDNLPIPSGSYFKSMALDNNGVPYVAIRKSGGGGGTGSYLSILKYDGGNWVKVGAEIAAWSFSDIAFDRNNDIYFMYENILSARNKFIKVLLKLSGNSWIEVAKQEMVDKGEIISLAQKIVFDNNNKIYIIAHLDRSTMDTGEYDRYFVSSYVFTVTGNEFVKVGDTLGRAHREWDNDLTIGKDNMPMVFYNPVVLWDDNLSPSYHNTPYDYGVKKFNGNSWQDVGNQDFIYKVNSMPNRWATAIRSQIRTAPDGTLYINYSRTSSYQYHFPNKMKPHHIRKLSGGRWVDIDLPSGACTGAPFGIDNNGALYFHLKDHRTIIKYE